MGQIFETCLLFITIKIQWNYEILTVVETMIRSQDFLFKYPFTEVLIPAVFLIVSLGQIPTHILL